MELTLPNPTDRELSKWNKSEYFARMYREHTNIRLKNKIDEVAFYNWIHHNYQSWINYNKQLTYNQFKKLI
jgi:hypothetical protein